MALAGSVSQSALSFWAWLAQYPNVLRVSGPGWLSFPVWVFDFGSFASLMCSESVALAGAFYQCAVFGPGWLSLPGCSEFLTLARSFVFTCLCPEWADVQ